MAAVAKEKLTPREIEVVKFLSDGFTVKATAKALELSPKTVDVHKTNLMRKLDVHNRAQLVVWAVRNGHVKV